MVDLSSIRRSSNGHRRRCGPGAAGALESTRLVQRLIMSRAVLCLVVLDTGEVSFEVRPAGRLQRCCPRQPSVAPGLERWDLDRWTWYWLRREVAPLADAGDRVRPWPAFASGILFSLSAMIATMTRLLGMLGYTGLDDDLATWFWPRSAAWQERMDRALGGPPWCEWSY